MLDRIPQVFISYSWTNELFKQSVEELAQKLMHDGVNVKLDIWDLKDGQDKYMFMEECVTNSDIDKVLIICDKGYASKADKRQGGVGTETAIISAEVYQNARQEKFIPVIMERDENGDPYMPAYLKSRIYKDLTGDNYEKEYESLLRNIYEKPARRKPELGSRPKWLDEEAPAGLYPVKEAELRVAGISVNRLKSTTLQEFIDVYIEALNPFFRKTIDENTYLEDFVSLKEYRNIFLDYLKQVALKADCFGESMADTFEKMYNTLYNVQTFVPNAFSVNPGLFDIFRVHIWELFVCTATYMLHAELYSDINKLLVHTYFLRMSPVGSDIRPVSYNGFYHYSNVLEEKVKPTLSGELKNKLTLTGHYLCNEREYLPIYSGKKLAEADLFLHQVYNGLGLEELTSYFTWFPICYIYAEEYSSMWVKLRSKRFCEKIMLIFGVDTVEKLKGCLVKCIQDKNARYRQGFVLPARAILDCIKENEIATLP